MAASFLVTDARAQDGAKPEPPPGPLLSPAPDYSQWVITFSYVQDSAAPGAPAAATRTETRTRMITTTKTAEIVHEEVVSGTGEKVEQWHIRGAEYMQIAGMKYWLQLRAGEGTGYAPMSATGFRDLDWISADAYVGMIKHGGKTCLVFIPGAPRGFSLTEAEDPAVGLQSLERYALIDMVTRLPVQTRSAGSTLVYRFGDEPTDKLALPPDLAQVIKDGIEMRARISQPAPRPY